MSLLLTDISKVQAGDRIIIDSRIMIIKCLDGPDRIGTYDLFLQDEHGTPAFSAVNGFVTMVR
jgi:hypothetical protein